MWRPQSPSHSLPRTFPPSPIPPFFTSVPGSSKRDDNFTCMHVRASPRYSFFFLFFFFSAPPAPAANNSCTRYLSSSLSLLTLDFRFCSPTTHRGMHLSRIFALGIVSWVGDKVGLREGRRERVVAGWVGRDLGRGTCHLLNHWTGKSQASSCLQQ